VSRRDFGEKPLLVEYALNELGMGLLVQMVPPWTWLIEQSEGVNEARKRFDEREEWNNALHPNARHDLGDFPEAYGSLAFDAGVRSSH